MEELRGRLEDDLREAYRRGEAEYGALPLEFDAYARRMIGTLVRRLGPDEAALGAALRGANSTDLFLAIACDLKTPGAWEILSRRFYPGLRAIALRGGASEAEAEEIARELPGALIAPAGDAATRIAGYDGTGSLFSWLASIANRHHLDRLRAAKKAPDMPVPATPSPPDVVVGAETGERVESALRETLLDLTMRETVLLVWKYRDNLSQHNMAVRLGVSEPRISQLMKRTIEKVRAGVRQRIRDESSPQWASRDQLWTALRNVVGNLLNHQ